MGYAELSPDRLMELGFAAPEVTDGAWSVRWDQAGPAVEKLWAATPPTVDFHTSGSTGPSRSWRRLRENLWLEAGMLADMVAPDRPAAAVCFAPPTHIYGALASVLVPARLGVPAWYRSTFFGAMPEVGGRVLVVATPWIFTLLLQHLDWVRGLEHLTVLYGSAMLPATAGEFLRQVGPERARIVEVLGSTEAGGIAFRGWRQGAPPEWTLFPDVSFTGATAAAAAKPEEEEVPLVVSSPRLAFHPGQAPLSRWEADDRVRPLGSRSFRLSGRAGRLVKVNGRRINLDEAEYSVRAVLDCADLALVPIFDQMIGEHVELLVVLKDGTELPDLDLAEAFERLGVRPKSVRVVPRIQRSALGKLRHGQALETDNAEVVTR